MLRLVTTNQAQKSKPCRSADRSRHINIIGNAASAKPSQRRQPQEAIDPEDLSENRRNCSFDRHSL
jgi:hypothetical protein